MSEFHPAVPPRRILLLALAAAWLAVLRNQVQQASILSPAEELLPILKQEFMMGTANPPAVANADSGFIGEMSRTGAVSLRTDPMPHDLPDYAKRDNYRNLPNFIPPLDSLIDPSPQSNHSIIGNVSYLLDFAIVGFGKCGTSTLMHWLADHIQTQVLRAEMWSLVGNMPQYLIARLHRTLKEDHSKLRGYKCPGDILQPHAMQYYNTLWPSARLFVGVRHPIWHFQSLYNFRVQNFRDSSMRHPNRLIGGCYPGHKMTCTLKSDWAYYLFALGKQFGRMSDGGSATGASASYKLSQLEDTIIHRHPYRRNPYYVTEIQPIGNKIFIYELGQLADTNASRRIHFQTDVQHYLGLTEPLSPANHFIPGRVWPEPVQRIKDQLKINICDYDYIPLRRELLRQARLSADWISQVFVHSPGVVTSNLEHFKELLDTWRSDPCGPESTRMGEEEAAAILKRTREAPENATKLELLESLKQYLADAP